MKVDYRCILESYTRVNDELFMDSMEIATEAEALNTTTPAAQNKEASNSTINQVQGNTTQAVDATKNNKLEMSNSRKQSLIQKLQAIIKKIGSMIQEAAIKIMNRLKLLFESDKGFFNMLGKRKANTQPLNAFKAITYNYNSQYLETTINTLQKVALGSIQQLGNFTSTPSDPKIKQILEADPNSAVNVMLSFFSKDKDQEGGPDVHSFVREMIDTFRGEKSEKMWNQSKIPELLSQTKGTKDLSNECNQIINQCKSSLNALKALEARTRMEKSTEQLMNISRRVTKATNIYNAFLTISRMYFELKLEQSLSARMLLKKFYNF